MIGAGQALNLFPALSYETFESSDWNALTSDVVVVCGDFNQGLANYWTEFAELLRDKVSDKAAEPSDVEPRGREARTKRDVGTTGRAEPG
jgi:hypothetical protein